MVKMTLKGYHTTNIDARYMSGTHIKGYKKLKNKKNKIKKNKECDNDDETKN